MGINIIGLVLVTAITFFNSIFGLFSGVLNLFAVAIATVTAVGTFDVLGGWLANQGLSASYAGATALVGVFVITLALLRTFSDLMIRGNVKLPSGVDWAGGAVCGFISAQLIVGVMLLGVLMLPLGNDVLGFTRFDRTGGTTDRKLNDYQQGSLWLGQDKFVSGLTAILSNGALSSGTKFDQVYPDLGDWVMWSGNVVQAESAVAPYRDGKGDGFKSGLEVKQWWLRDNQVEARYRAEEPTASNRQPRYTVVKFAVDAGAGKTLLGVRLELKGQTADRDKSNRTHLFRPTMIRLVGDVDGKPHQYFPQLIRGGDSKLIDSATGQPLYRIVDPDTNYQITSSDATIDALFEVPKDFKPSFVEYRRYARADVPASAKLGGTEEGGAPAAATPEPPAVSDNQQAQGATRFVDVVSPTSGVVEFLPWGFSREALRRQNDTKVEDGKFAGGRVAGFVDDLVQPNKDIERYFVPEGYGLLQIRYSPKQAQSLVGQVMNYAAQLNQYKAIDDTGQSYMLCGYFAVVERNGRQYLEMYYTGQPDDPAFRGMLDFKQIEAKSLPNQDGAELGLLFLVPKGRRIVELQNQVGAGISGLDYPIP